MRNISILDDIEEVILQLVRAIPEIYLDYDLDSVELVQYHEDGVIYSADIVSVEDDDYETVIGDVVLNSDLFVEIDIYSDEKRLDLTFDQIIED